MSQLVLVVHSVSLVLSVSVSENLRPARKKKVVLKACY